MLFGADSGLPNLSRYTTSEEKLRVLENYLLLLLENLRYTLRNLTPDNFNQQELSAWVDTLRAGQVVAETIITRELYSQYGAIADLTVDSLRTDWKRAVNYLEEDTSPIHYITIHDEEISLCTATTDGTSTQQLERNGQCYWWTDAACTQMTTEDTGLPVTVYCYRELVKAQFCFAPVKLANGADAVMPVLTFGAGTGATAQAGKGYVYKHTTGMDLHYHTSDGRNIASVCFQDDGFVDWSARRASVHVDTQKGCITVTPEGSAQPISIACRQQEDGLALTWPDGAVSTVTTS